MNITAVYSVTLFPDRTASRNASGLNVVNTVTGFLPVKGLEFWYSINPDGEIYDNVAGRLLNKNNTLSSDCLVVEGNSISFVKSTAVAHTWWNQPEEEWIDGYWAPAIADYRAFMLIPEKDKRDTGHRNLYGVKYIVSRDGRIFNDSTGRELKTQTNIAGYAYLSNRVFFNMFVHRIVAKAFCPIDPALIAKGYSYESLVVDHIDGNKLNNHASNLEWVTPRENTQRASNKRTPRRWRFVSDDQLEQVWKLLQDGLTDKAIAEQLDMSPTTVGNIRQGDSPRYITDKYTWRKHSRVPLLDQVTAHEVIKDFNAGMTYLQLANKYCISTSSVGTILREMADCVTRKRPKKAVAHRSIPHEKIIRICELLSQGLPDDTISRQLDVPFMSVWQVRKRRLYREYSREYTWPDYVPSQQETDFRIKCDKIYRLYGNGRTRTEISRELDVPFSVVAKICKQIDEEILTEKVAKLIEQNLDDITIMKTLDLSIYTLRAVRSRIEAKKKLADR